MEPLRIETRFGAKRLVEDNGANLSVASTEGAESAFITRFPAVEAAAAGTGALY